MKKLWFNATEPHASPSSSTSSFAETTYELIPENSKSDISEFSFILDELEGLDGYFCEPPTANLSSPKSLETCLKLNRALQTALRDQLTSIDDFLGNIKDLQKRIQSLPSHRRPGQRKRIRLQHAFSATKGSPEEESYTAKPPTTGPFTEPSIASSESAAVALVRTMASEYIKAMKHPARWSDKERAALAKGIRHFNQLILVERMLSFSPASDAPNKALKNEQYMAAVARVQAKSHRELEENLLGLDWSKISAVFVSTRSPIDCFIRWTTFDHPLISHASFTAAEKETLLGAVDALGSHGKWIDVAQRVGPHRTAWQCLSEWQKIIASKRPAPTAISKWTPAEDQLLLEAIQMYGINDCWSEISETLDGRRSTNQIHHRWSKTLNPSKRLGKWSALEDAYLLAAVRRFGTANWSLIRDFVPNRTDVQCRERYMNILHPDVSRKSFSPQEDQLLLQAVTAHGSRKWSLIASLLPGRTDNQCSRRWRSLVREREEANSEPEEGMDGDEAVDRKGVMEKD